MKLKKYVKQIGFLALAMGAMQPLVRADDEALIDAVAAAVAAAGTGLSTVLVAVIAVVATFILFKLIKRGANKV